MLNYNIRGGFHFRALFGTKYFLPTCTMTYRFGKILIQKIMERNDIFLSIRPKPKQANKSVIIKSVEGNVQRMFEGRKELLGLKTSGLEHITFMPTLTNISSSMDNYNTYKNDDMMSRASNYGYHSSEEPDHKVISLS